MQLRRAVVVDTNVVSYIYDGDREARYYETSLSPCTPRRFLSSL